MANPAFPSHLYGSIEYIVCARTFAIDKIAFEAAHNVKLGLFILCRELTFSH